MNQPKLPQLLHIRSAVIGGQLVSLAMRGQMQPADTTETLILQQLANNGLVRCDVDLSMLTQKASATADIRRCYAIKIMECLLVRSDPSLMSLDALEEVMRKSWKLAAVMEEQDFVGQQIETLKTPQAG